MCVFLSLPVKPNSTVLSVTAKSYGTVHASTPPCPVPHGFGKCQRRSEQGSCYFLSRSSSLHFQANTLQLVMTRSFCIMFVIGDQDSKRHRTKVSETDVRSVNCQRWEKCVGCMCLAFGGPDELTRQRWRSPVSSQVRQEPHKPKLHLMDVTHRVREDVCFLKKKIFFSQLPPQNSLI